MKKKDQKIDKAYNAFLLEDKTGRHRKAICYLLSGTDLDGLYKDVLKDKEGIADFFLMWERAACEEMDEKEAASLFELAKYSKKYFNSKQYKKLGKIYCELAFRHVCKYLEIESRDDFNELTDVDLVTKKIIPSEILMPYFLLETLAKNDKFDWNRNEEISVQNLACLITCFTDIFDFINAEECDCPECLAYNNKYANKD